MADVAEKSLRAEEMKRIDLAWAEVKNEEELLPPYT